MLMTRMTEDSSTLTLFVAFELSEGTWKLAFARERGAPPRIRNVPARDLVAVDEEIREAKRRLGLPAECSVSSCYEAGRDGFWFHRWLLSRGIVNHVVDPASVAVDRRGRRVKTDRVDATKLLTHLIRHWEGERVWSVVRVPSEEQEDTRRLHRERDRLVRERSQHQSRIRGLLAAQGIKVKKVTAALLQVRRPWDSGPLPQRLATELTRELERLELVQKQVKTLCRQIEAEQAGDSQAAVASRQLRTLTGIGLVGSQVLSHEFFGWRSFSNGRQVGALSGLTGTPHQSGGMKHEQGISKAGNRRVRAVMAELAWCWLRYQPDSALSRWYKARFGDGPGRLRRIGVVALSRKLLVALWRYLQYGVVPDGAIMAVS